METLADNTVTTRIPPQLIRSDTRGKGAAQIGWGTHGDFARCQAFARRHGVPGHMIDGFCANLHKLATGEWPGINAHKGAHAIALDYLVAAMGPKFKGRRWSGPLAPIGVKTGDGRIFPKGVMKYQTFPMPFGFQEHSGRGHDGAVTVGVIEHAEERMHNGKPIIWGHGYLLNPDIIPDVRKAEHLIEHGIAGASVDLDSYTAALRPDIDGKPLQSLKEGRMRSATLVRIPAFADLRIEFDPDEDEKESITAGLETFTVNSASWKGAPVAPREAQFDADDAVSRIEAWAGSDPEKMFLWLSDGPALGRDGYKLPWGDIIDGKPYLIYHAIYAAAALLSGAHGGLPNIPDVDKAKLRGVITEIYAHLANELNDPNIRAPWDRRPEDEQVTEAALVSAMAAVVEEFRDIPGGHRQPRVPGVPGARRSKHIDNPHGGEFEDVPGRGPHGQVKVGGKWVYPAKGAKDPVASARKIAKEGGGKPAGKTTVAKKATPAKKSTPKKAPAKKTPAKKAPPGPGDSTQEELTQRRKELKQNEAMLAESSNKGLAKTKRHQELLDERETLQRDIDGLETKLGRKPAPEKKAVEKKAGVPEPKKTAPRKGVTDTNRENLREVRAIVKGHEEGKRADALRKRRQQIVDEVTEINDRYETDRSLDKGNRLQDLKDHHEDLLSELLDIDEKLDAEKKAEAPEPKKRAPTKKAPERDEILDRSKRRPGESEDEFRDRIREAGRKEVERQRKQTRDEQSAEDVAARKRANKETVGTENPWEDSDVAKAEDKVEDAEADDPKMTDAEKKAIRREVLGKMVKDNLSKEQADTWDKLSDEQKDSVIDQAVEVLHEQDKSPGSRIAVVDKKTGKEVGGKTVVAKKPHKVTDAQQRALDALEKDPDAKIHPATRKVLEREGLIKAKGEGEAKAPEAKGKTVVAKGLTSSQQKALEALRDWEAGGGKGLPPKINGNTMRSLENKGLAKVHVKAVGRGEVHRPELTDDGRKHLGVEAKVPEAKAPEAKGRTVVAKKTPVAKKLTTHQEETLREVHARQQRGEKVTNETGQKGLRSNTVQRMLDEGFLEGDMEAAKKHGSGKTVRLSEKGREALGLEGPKNEKKDLGVPGESAKERLERVEKGDLTPAEKKEHARIKGAISTEQHVKALDEAKNRTEALKYLEEQKLTNAQLKEIAQKQGYKVPSDATKEQLHMLVTGGAFQRGYRDTVRTTLERPRLADATGAEGKSAKERLADLKKMEGVQQVKDYVSRLSRQELVDIYNEGGHGETVRRDMNAERLRSGLAVIHGVKGADLTGRRQIQEPKTPVDRERRLKAAGERAAARIAGPKKAATREDVQKALTQLHQDNPDRSYISMTELREKIGGDREEQDRVLRALAADHTIHTLPEDNQKMLTAQDRADALELGGEPQHAVRLTKRPTAGTTAESKKHPATAKGVRDAFGDIKKERGEDTEWVSVADVRDRMGGTREEQDRALRDFEQEPDTNIVPQANSKATSQRNREGAVRIGGEDKDFLTVIPPETERDTGPKKPTGRTVVAKKTGTEARDDLLRRDAENREKLKAKAEGRSAEIQKVKDALDKATSREEAMKTIDGLGATATELKQLAKDLDVPVHSGATKLQIRNAIVGLHVGRRLDSRAIFPGGSTSKAEKVAEKLPESKAAPEKVSGGQVDIHKDSTKPRLENNWGGRHVTGQAYAHPDGIIPTGIKGLGRNGAIEVDGDRLDNVLDRIATDTVLGKMTGDEQVQALRTLARRFPEGGTRRSIEALADDIDAPKRPVPESVKGAPEPLRDLMDYLMKFPIARGGGEMDRSPHPSYVDSLDQLLKDWHEGKVSPLRLVNDLESKVYNRRHESMEGKVPVDRKISDTVQELQKMLKEPGGRDKLTSPKRREGSGPKAEAPARATSGEARGSAAVVARGRASSRPLSARAEYQQRLAEADQASGGRVITGNVKSDWQRAVGPRDRHPLGVRVQNMTLPNGYTVGSGRMIRRNGTVYLVEDQPGQEADKIVDFLDRVQDSLPNGRVIQHAIAWMKGTNPDDPYWSERFGTKHVSAATASGGKVVVWGPGTQHSEDTVEFTLRHEYGHNVDGRGEGALKHRISSSSPQWLAAIERDAQVQEPPGFVPHRIRGDEVTKDHSHSGEEVPKGVTPYGRSSHMEDFAESVMLYMQDIIGNIRMFSGRHDAGRPIADVFFRDLYPARAALLDLIFPDMAAQQKARPRSRL